MNTLKPEEEAELDGLLEMINAGDHYSILGVSRESDLGEIKTAYFTLSKTYHPDMFYRRAADGVQEKVEAIFTGINLSYEVLSDEALRRKFDNELVRKERESSSLNTRTRRRGSNADEGSQAPSEVLEDDASSAVISSRSRGDRARARARIREELGVSKSRVRQPESSSRRRRRERSASSETTGRFTSNLREKLEERLAKAKSYYEKGLVAMESEDWAKAGSALQMATQLDPSNDEYKNAHRGVRPKAAAVRASGFIRAAEGAESFRNVKEALYNYQKAVACDPPEGTAFYRLGKLQLEYASEPREALKNFRRAVSKEPSNIKYRLALAELYVREGMEKNAQREYQKVLAVEPKSKEAKNGLKKLRF